MVCYQAASVTELHAQSQRYCAQLQEYNANLQKDVQAAAAQLQTSALQLQRLQVSHTRYGQGIQSFSKLKPFQKDLRQSPQNKITAYETPSRKPVS